MTPLAVRRRIARNIRRMASEQELTLNYVCARAQVTRSAFFRALQAKASMTTDSLTKVANALRVDPVELLRQEKLASQAAEPSNGYKTPKRR